MSLYRFRPTFPSPFGGVFSHETGSNSTRVSAKATSTAPEIENKLR